MVLRRLQLVMSMFLRKYGTVFGIVGACALMLYPVAIAPQYESKKWKKVQQSARDGIRQEDVQPGGMRVWSDPFGKQKKLSKDDLLPPQLKKDN